MNEEWNPLQSLSRPVLAALASFAAVPVLMMALSRPEPRHAPDPQVTALSTALKQSAELVSAQQDAFERLKTAQKPDTETIAELKDQVKRLTELVESVTEKLDGTAGSSKTAADQLNYLHYRLGRVETSLTRIDADLHTPQILNQMLEKQKALARPQ